MTLRNATIAVLLALTGVTGTALADAPDLSKNYGGTVARFKKPPQIDGRIKPGEWDGAVATRGFQGHKGSRLNPRRGGTYFGFTEQRLYFAVVSELPPTKELVAQKKYRDAKLIFDDNIEIWIDPHRTAEGAGEGTYYQLMVNPIGTILDVKQDPTKGAPDQGWDADWNVGSKLHKDEGVWTIELSVPVEQVGLKPGNVTGQRVGLLMARDFMKGFSMASWFPHNGPFDSRPSYPSFHLTEDQPTVQIRSLGKDFYDGHINLKAEIYNPGAARRAKVHAHATSSDMPGVEQSKTIELPAGGSTTYTFSAEKFHADAKHQLKFRVTSADGKTRYLMWDIHQWSQAPAEKWRVETGPQPDRAARLAYYPSYERIKVRVRPDNLAKAHRDAKQAQVTVVDPDGKQILQKTMQWEGEGANQTFEVGDLPAGQYTARIKVKGRDKPLERTFTRKYFAFENNQLGQTDKVYPPFEPITGQGHTVRVVQRRYTKGGLGLWKSVEAAGAEMLAAPVSLVANGDEKITGTGKFQKRDDQQVVYTGSGEHPAVNVRTRTTTGYDGTLRVEMTLKPGAEKKQLDSLTLDIPIKDSRAPLWHVTTTSLRSNPAGFTPEGSGKVWGSKEFPDGDWYGNFKPYIWLGAEKRGLAWFADNDKNWVLDGDPKKGNFDSCLTLHRKDGVMTLRVHFVQKPVTIKEERKIVFGLMTTPVKPMPEDWRKLQVNKGYKDYPVHNRMGAQYWGSPTVMYSAYPVNGDMSILSKMQEARLNGRVRNEDQWINRWIQRNFPDGKTGDKSRKSIDRLKQLAGNAIGNGAHADYYTVYWEEFHRTAPYSHPEVRVFGNEWTGGFGTGGVHALPDSYLDFGAWYGAEFLRRGIGLYFDNAFPKRTHDKLTTAAYELPNGDTQPSANMWQHRKYLRRIWVLHQQLAPAKSKPLMVLHMTNTHIAAYMGFNTMNLGLEWKFGPEPQQSKFTPQMLRAQTIGLQTGNIPAALSKVKKTKTEKQDRKAKRTRFGTLMSHEIRPDRPGKTVRRMYDTLLDFGYGRDDCRVYNYWQENDPARPSDQRIKTLTLQRDGQAMVLLCTWNPEPANATVRFDTETLGFTPANAVDVESGNKLNWKGNRVKMKLDGYATRIIRLK